MSQFPQAPPAGSYVPPPNDANEASQRPGYNSSPYQSSTPGYGAPHQSHKKGFGQMFDQAVTTGKPMLNKLGKTISSKLGSKQPAPSTPQYLESYQNYQQHYQHQQPQPQGFSPQQPQQQQQWQQPQQPQSAYTNQTSPYPSSNPQSTYATPASGHSGQNNYFPQQQQSPTPQTPQQQQPNVPAYNQTQYAQGQNVGFQQQGEAGQSFHHGSFAQNNGSGLAQQGQFQQVQPAQGQFEGQQSGVVGTAQSPVQNGPVSPLQSNVAPNVSQNTGQEHFNQQQTWVPPTPGTDQTSHVGLNNNPAPHQQNNEPYNATPPPATSLQQFGAPPAVPVHPNQQQHQQQSYAQQQQDGTVSDVPGHPDKQQQQQQWGPISPATPHGHFANQVPSTTSPPPPPTPGSQPQIAHVPSQPMQHQPTPPPQNTKPPPAGPTEFIAELPADFGNLNVTDGGKSERPPSAASQTSPSSTNTYQAYQPPGRPGRAPSFTVARRAVSTSSLPLANPWRVADPATELPTREFYILADLLFDALDRRCEPQNTGLLEASKILESWKAHGMAQEAVQLFQYDNYSAVGKLWALASIPHVMVPLQPSLTPPWNFQAQLNSHDLRIPEPAPSTAAYPSYFPAINRAGWYKHLFLEIVCESYSLQTLLSTFCADTYKPAALNQPDLQKQDRAELPELAARAHAVRNAALPRVCAETAQRLHSTLPSHA